MNAAIWFLVGFDACFVYIATVYWTTKLWINHKHRKEPTDAPQA